MEQHHHDVTLKPPYLFTMCLKIGFFLLKLYLFFFILVCVMPFINCNHEGALISRLLKNYTKDARPRINVSQPVEVTVDFFMTRLDELNLRKESFTVSGWLYSEWIDDFLKWNPEEFGNISKLVLPAHSIWLPDLSVGNSVDQIFREEFIELFRVSIYWNGKVVWEPAGVFSTSCPIDITYYPFDHQTCEISFGMWQYTTDQVTLINRTNVIGFENYDRNGEWVIEKTKVYQDAFVYDCCPELNFPEVNFKVHIRRKFLYYFINIMIPCLMMSILVLMVFYLPPDAGEKISLGVTVLLSFSVFQLMIAEIIPTSANTTPLLEIYLLCFMGASTFSVTVSVFVLNLHHRTEYNPPPPLLRKVCLVWIAPWLCLGGTKRNAVRPVDSDTQQGAKNMDSQDKVEMRIDIEKPQDSSDLKKPESKDLILNKIQTEKSTQSDPSVDKETRSYPEIKVSTSQNLSANTNLVNHATAKSTMKLMKSIARFDSDNSLHSRREFLEAVKELYQEVCQTRRDDILEHALENEWKLIARVVDRCFFIICTLILIVSSAVIFGIMPYYHEEEQVWI